MNEEMAYNIFLDFYKDLPRKMVNIMIDMDHNAYYTVITQPVYSSRRSLYHSKEDTRYFSFKELYEEMCDLFYQFDEGKENAIRDIIHLKNFVNLKIMREKMKEDKNNGKSV